MIEEQNRQSNMSEDDAIDYIAQLLVEMFLDKKHDEQFRNNN
ncbi:MAG TPA: hypothetical protein PLJ00_15940 [Chitinophagales bacterium]|nr:hypothetical protein [Chitinophagales bacterium]HRG29389.1 hypothetical protein [Chitinophagales bacterium]HRG85197.1 hypothetical protein [Chitinophagales bacterium]HRH52280.1 hypothetical protein [Chitinophagales bacterium]